MELRQIRDFVAVVKAGSFAAASRVLNVSQPGLGYQIKQLELDLGATLLVRHSRGVALTPAGTLFMADAEHMLALVGQSRSRVRELLKAQQTELRIGLSPTPQQLLAPVLSALGAPDRGVRVTFREGLSSRLLQDLRADLLDVAICIFDGDVADLRTVPLYREHLHLIGPPDPAGGSDVPFADLSEYRLTAGPKDHLPRRLIDEEAARRGIGLDIAQELEPGGLRRSLVRHGSAYTVSSLAMFLDEVEAGELSARRIVDPAIALNVQMVCSPGLSPANENALLDVVRGAVAAHPAAADPADGPD